MSAERKNEFPHRYRERGWVKDAITINDSELTFYDGTRHPAPGAKPWGQSRRCSSSWVTADLSLAADLDDGAAVPGLLLLDSPKTKAPTQGWGLDLLDAAS